jgi:hypothetical protein
MCCGSLVESGADPALMAGAITARLEQLLDQAARFREAWISYLPEDYAEQEEPDEKLDEQARSTAEAVLPAEAEAWTALQQFYLPGVAVYSRHVQSRVAAQRLLEPALALSAEHDAGHWLAKVLQVLHDEPLLVIEPASQSGIVGRMSGVAENFQLNVLLMDIMPRGWFSGRRVSKSAADVAWGRGPQCTDEAIVGVWNLYTWQGLSPTQTLPPAGDMSYGSHWVWNEGVPADIPLFAEHRVVLLGPPSYQRSWRSQRAFDGMSATIDHRPLTKGEASDWLERIAVAPRTT